VPENYHHGNLRAVLIEEGVKLVEEKGVNGLTLREIGDRARVSRTAPYRHFADKAELLAAISEAGFTQFADTLEAARDSVRGRFAAKLDAMGLAYLSFAENHRAYYEVMFGAGCGPEKTPGGPASRRAFEVLEGLIRAGQAAGDVRPGETITMAKIVWATTHGIAMLRLETDFSDGGAGTRLMRAVGEILRVGLTVYFR
jgi:AcrR family transcriptional regulator